MSRCPFSLGNRKTYHALTIIMPKIYKGHRDASPTCHSERLHAINKMKFAFNHRNGRTRNAVYNKISDLLPAEIHEDENLCTEAGPHDF